MSRECRIPGATLRRHLQQGMDTHSIGLRYGWAASTVRKRCTALGLLTSGTPQRFSDADLRARIFDLSKSLAAIGEELGVSSPAVLQRARKLGLPTSQGARYHAAKRLDVPMPERLFRTPMGRSPMRAACAA